MNSPYGVHNCLAKQIIKEVVPLASSSVVLVPKNTYKRRGLLGYVEDIEVVDNCFSDANIDGLSIARLSPKIVDKYTSLADFIMTEKDKQWMKANSGVRSLYYIGTRGIEIDNKRRTSPSKDYLRDSGVSEKLNESLNMSLEDLVKANRIFAFCAYTPSGGPGNPDGVAGIYNFKGEWPEKWWTGCPVSPLIFENQTCRDNFRDWWYSSEGLCKYLLDLICRVDGADAATHEYYFPNLDWSRPWHDQEILKEIGLPEDFLTC